MDEMGKVVNAEVTSRVLENFLSILCSSPCATSVTVLDTQLYIVMIDGQIVKIHILFGLVRKYFMKSNIIMEIKHKYTRG